MSQAWQEIQEDIQVEKKKNYRLFFSVILCLCLLAQIVQCLLIIYIGSQLVGPSASIVDIGSFINKTATCLSYICH